MSLQDYKNELALAKMAAMHAGNILLNDKININKVLSSSKKDIKLQADLIFMRELQQQMLYLTHIKVKRWVDLARMQVISKSI